MMREPRSFAYSLSQIEDGWRWSVYDENGETVARGSDPSRASAQAQVETLLQSAGSASSGIASQS